LQEELPMLKRFAPFLISFALAACAGQPQLQPQPQPPQVALPPAPPPGEPPGIVGLEEGQLRAVFGQPSFIRKDGAVEMWRYDTPVCRAFFFLYPGAGDVLAVRHVETLPAGVEIAADTGCLDALLRNKSATPVS
jgi:hypothetical protein